MVNGSKYKRIYMMFKREDPGYNSGGSPAGYVKMEARDSIGRLFALVQNLREGRGKFDYVLYILRRNERNIVPVFVGKIPVSKNSGMLEWEFSPENVASTGLSVDEFNIAVVLAEYKDGTDGRIKCPLAAYKGSKAEWRNALEKAMHSADGKEEKREKGIGKNKDIEEEKEIEGKKEAGEEKEREEEGERIEEDEGIVEEREAEKEKKIEEKKEIDKERDTGEEGYIGKEMKVVEEKEIKEDKGACEEKEIEGCNEIGEVKDADEEKDAGEDKDMEIEKKEGNRKIIIEKDFVIKGFAPCIAGNSAREGEKIMASEHEEYLESLVKETGGDKKMRKTDEGCVREADINAKSGDRENTVAKGTTAGSLNRLREQFDRHFAKFDPFHSGRRDYKWWKMNNPVFLNNILYQCNIKTPMLFNSAVMIAQYKYGHLIVGIFTDKAKYREYLVCGVPGIYNIDEKPFGSMCRWAQQEGGRARYGAFGYWLVYIDPVTGQFLKV